MTADAAAALLGYALHIAAVAERGQGVGGQAAGFAPGSGEGAHIAPEGAAEELLGGHQVAGLLIDGQLLAIDERGLQIQLLGRDDGLHHGLDLAFQVVALVDHVGHFARAGLRPGRSAISWKMRKIW